MVRVWHRTNAASPIMIYLNSSAIRAVDYDAQSETLYIQFTSQRRVFTFPGVPYAVYVGLIEARSHGAYYNAFIRGRYA